MHAQVSSQGLTSDWTPCPSSMAQSFHQQPIRQNPKWSIYGTFCTPFGSPNPQPTDILQQEASRGKPMGCITQAPTCNASAHCHCDVQEMKPNAPNTLAFYPNVTLPFCACTQPNRACSRLLTNPYSVRIGRQVSVGKKQSSDSPEQEGLLGFPGPAS